MPTGPGSRRKRPRNDLDDYLDEVESKLFCVTKADKQCLLRDLKAHVRELTIDPSSALRYQGKYQISMDQLREDIGEPDEIVAMYISSVSKKVPSIGLQSVLGISVLILLSNVIIGLDRYIIGITTEVDASTWLSVSGLGLALCCLILLGLTLFVLRTFDRNHRFIAFLMILLGVFGIPLAIALAGAITQSLFITKAVQLQDWYTIMIMIDILVFTLIGLYLYLKHFQVLNQRSNFPIE